MLKGYPWTAIYDEFEKIAYAIIDEKGDSDETYDFIENCIREYYETHKHEDPEAYEIAYRKWREWID